ncbi:MAG: diguanylate cyclase [Altererythrobacter sp.]|nr:diguanylate cyclase [Altererythrobacter sp.]
MQPWARLLTAALLALFALPATALAQTFAPPCARASGTGESLAGLASTTQGWRCGNGAASLAAERTVLRFAVEPGQQQPAWFGTRSSRFRSLTLAVVADGRIVASARHDAGGLAVASSGNAVYVPLPPYAGKADTVLAAIDGPTSRALFTDAAIYASEPGTSSEAIGQLLIAALISGMLLTPLFFYAAFYRIMREPFMLWYLAISLAMLTQSLIRSGLVSHFLSVTIDTMALAGTLSFGLGVAAASGFAAAFIERGRMHPLLRRGLYVAGIWVAAFTLIRVVAPDWIRPVATPLYYAIFIPVLTLFVFAMIDALRRGSRAVRFQIVGWAPFILVGVIRIVTMLVPTLRQSEAVGLFHFAMVTVTVATTLGVADRIMLIRRQRDHALVRARSFEELAERDDLTGLYNRRALEGWLNNSAVQRFTGFALFDLDHFKRVNDAHGHDVGDAVLRTAASVLAGHEGAVALRMGGEEFLLLLRGDDVAQRVERLREAIPVRIAREVEELEMLVTASAGLVICTSGCDVGTDFAALYREADDLLYEAKHNGRNLLASAVRLDRRGAAPAIVAA